VVRDQALFYNVVLVETEVLRTDVERDESLPGRQQPQLRDADLDHEAAAWPEMRCNVLEARHLPILVSQVVDRVEDEVRERESPLDPRRREIADRDRDVLAPGFLT